MNFEALETMTDEELSALAIACDKLRLQRFNEKREKMWTEIANLLVDYQEQIGAIDVYTSDGEDLLGSLIVPRETGKLRCTFRYERDDDYWR
ncbi:MAG: hypothetical protein IKB70_08245 [Bacilli bacterium]|nr:hypothetical protein [Bacilli bacterium]